MLHSTMCSGAANAWARTCRRRCKGGGRGGRGNVMCGGGRSGQCRAHPLSWRPALPVWSVRGRCGLEPHVRAASPMPGGSGGVFGGQSSCLEGGAGLNRTPAGHTALLVHGRAQGVLGSPPRVLGSPPRVLGPPPRDCWSPPFISCRWATGATRAGGHDVGKAQEVARGRSVTHAMPCGYRG